MFELLTNSTLFEYPFYVLSSVGSCSLRRNNETQPGSFFILRRQPAVGCSRKGKIKQKTSLNTLCLGFYTVFRILQVLYKPKRLDLK